MLIHLIDVLTLLLDNLPTARALDHYYGAISKHAFPTVFCLDPLNLHLTSHLINFHLVMCKSETLSSYVMEFPEYDLRDMGCVFTRPIN